MSYVPGLPLCIVAYSYIGGWKIDSKFSYLNFCYISKNSRGHKSQGEAIFSD